MVSLWFPVQTTKQGTPGTPLKTRHPKWVAAVAPDNSGLDFGIGEPTREPRTILGVRISL